jgi:hypothetical protein
MHITETLFEPDDGLSVCGEAEVPRFDDSGVDWSHSNLMYAGAFDRAEVVLKG